MNIKRISAIAALGIVLTTSTAFAAVTTKEGNDNIEMRFGNDFYGAGNSVGVMQSEPDDVFAAGNRIIVTGEIGGDVNAAGSNVTINGIVHDDVRIFAGDATINGDVEGDVMMFGGTLYIAEGSSISGSILVAGGEITINGDIFGDANIYGGSVKLNGDIEGTVYVRSENVAIAGMIGGNTTISAQTLKLNDGTTIRGDLNYWQGEGEIDSTGKVMGTATFDSELEQKKPINEAEAAGMLAALLAAVTIVSILYAALMIGVFMLVTRTFFIDAAKKLHTQPWWALLTGFLYFAAMPFAILLLMITFIGIPLALMLLAFYVFSIIFAKVIASIVFTRWFELRSKKKWHPAAVYFGAIGMYIVLSLLSIIPFVGWLICLFVCVMAFGAFEMVKFERVKKIM